MKILLRGFVLALALAACTSTYQRRGTEDPLRDPIPLSRLKTNIDTQLDLEARSIEQFEDFDVGTIEISDDGFFNEAQAKQVLEHVEERITDDNALVVVFVHGWHHGPRICDRDICCFREVLHGLAMANPRRKITGVYLGWRGESISTPIVNLLSLWDRNAKAERIGRTGGAQLLLKLDQMYREAKKKHPHMLMITAGHSLGGAIVFSAMRQIASGNVGDVLGQQEGTRCTRLSPEDCNYRIIRAEGGRFEASNKKQKAKALRAHLGDLVILVNPAIEASQYQPFDSDLPDSTITEKPPNDRDSPYEEAQLPVMVTFASQADLAVGVAFPAGRVVSSLVRPGIIIEPARRIGLGHYLPQRTHLLDFKRSQSSPTGTNVIPVRKPPLRELPAAKGSSDEGSIKRASCGCSELTDDVTLHLADKTALDFTMADQTFFGGQLSFRLDSARAERCRQARKDCGEWDPHSPFMVVETTPTVISEHSDIYNPVFVAFLTKFISAYEVANDKKLARRDGAVSAEESQRTGKLP